MSSSNASISSSSAVYSSSNATSPFECLPTATLTPSGLLLLDTADGEVELLQLHDTSSPLELRSESSEPLSSNSNYRDRIGLSSIVVTTHRIVFSIVGEKQQRFLHFSNIHALEQVSTSVFFSQHAKIRLSTYSLGDLLLVVPKKDSSSILTTLEKTHGRRAWETASRLQASTISSIGRRRVGVDAIVERQKRKHDRASQLTEQAFTGDAETLLKEATELVTIIQKYVSTLEHDRKQQQRQQQQSGTTKTTNDNDNENNDKTVEPLVDMLQDMGMTSALPVSSARSTQKSNLYMERLARQLADFLRPKLLLENGSDSDSGTSSSFKRHKQVGAIQQQYMTLTDVYCLYNRARGTNLVSPQDLMSAIECMDGIPELQLSLKTFPSGLKVVQSSLWEEDDFHRQLQHMCCSSRQNNKNTFITALDVSRQFNMSPLLAKEALLEAERKEFLCRDVTLETIRFYANRFAEFMKKDSKW